MDLTELFSTPLLHKPVFYGSSIFSLAFLSFVWLHIVFAILVPCGIVGAVVMKKGSALHLRFGKIFFFSIVGIVVSGVVIDLVRLLFYVEANHTKYSGFTMPNTYPARFSFLYASFCIVFLLLQVLPHPNRYWKRSRAWVVERSWVSLVLSAIGLAITALIFVKYNPWTGALWMIWMFTLAMSIGWLISANIKSGWLLPVVQHRFNMLVLASFASWGLYQSFVPAYEIFVSGASIGTGPYSGNIPGAYTPRFIGFLREFVPFYFVGMLVFAYYSLPIKKTRSKRAP